MIKSKQILRYLSENKERLFNELQLKRIGIFGSTARGEQHEHSDIDLIVEFNENTADLFSKKNKLKEEIETRFNVPVDICREKYIKPYFKKQILAETIYV